MRRTLLSVLVAVVAACLIALLPLAAGRADDDSSPIYGVKIPEGYRDWKLISVAHEEGELNDLRAILGNDIAINAFSDGTFPFPDGAIIARLAWKYVPSAENNAAFGRDQSFVPGAATNVQFEVKDSKKYAETGGWGFGEFKDGKPSDEAMHKTCFPCHESAKGRDFIFTHYAP
jgi:Cytochrome P460